MPRLAAAALAAVLLGGCGQPLLSVQLDVPELRVTMPDQPFPASPVDPSSFCDHAPGDPPPADCVARELSYDLAAEIPTLDGAASLDLRLTDVVIRLVSGDPTALGGVRRFRFSVQDPDSGAWTVLASYSRASATATPAALSAAGDSSRDLGPWARGGALATRLEIDVDPSSPPGAFTASVEAGFSLVVKLDSASL